MFDELSHATLCYTTTTENLHGVLSCLTGALSTVLLQECNRSVASDQYRDQPGSGISNE